MTTRQPRRHVARGLLGGLVLGVGVALMLWLFGVTSVNADVAIAACIVIGLALGLVRLPRTAAEVDPEAKN
jgi:ferric-dicitrate binding protein FerR (iron transport regulator)